MVKKNFFERMGLIEKTETESSDVLLKNEQYEDLSQYSIEFSDIPEDMSLEDVITIEDIYSKCDLLKMENSIFKVDEFLRVLPKELHNDAKKTSVLGILSASGLLLDDLIKDSVNRQTVLESTLNAFTNETNHIIESKSIKIEELELQIDQLKKEINNRKKSQEEQEDIINKEKEKIKNIVNFIQ